MEIKGGERQMKVTAFVQNQVNHQCYLGQNSLPYVQLDVILLHSHPLQKFWVQCC